MESLSVAQARRIALAAQGFLDKRHAVPTMRTFQRTLERTGVLQVDSVNVLRARPPHAALLPDGPVRRRPAAPRRRGAAAPDRGVLGARPGVHAGRAVAGDAAPDGVVPRQARQVGLRRRQRRARDEPARRAPRPRPLDRARPGRRAAAREGQLGLELVRDPQDARLPLHVGRGRDRRPQHPVRDPLRPAREGHPAGRARPADPVPRRGQPRAGPPGGPLARGRDRPGPARLLPDAGGRDRDRPSTSSSRRASWSR